MDAVVSRADPRTVMVVLAVVEREGRVLLIQEAKQRLRGKWNLPGGRLEPGESLVEALRREIREEAGIEVTVRDLLYLDQLASQRAEVPSRLRFVFRADAASDRLKTEPDEHSLQARWVPRSQLGTLELRNAIVTQMIELADTAAAGLPVSAVGALSLEERERELLEEERRL